VIRQFVCISAVVAATATALTADDWYRFRGPTLNGRSAEIEWSHQWSAAGPKIAWTAEVGIGFSSVSISDGRLYTIGNEENVDTIHCLSTETGEQLWTHTYSSPTDPNEFEGGPTSTPTIDGDLVFTLSRSGDLFALNKTSGLVHWNQDIAAEAEVRIPAWGFSGSPYVHDDLLILNVGDAGAAVNKKTGQLVWKSEDRDSGYSSPVPLPQDGREGLVLGSARSYVCVEPNSGKEMWRQRWLTTFGCNAADAIVSGNHVFLSSGYNRGSALLSVTADAPEMLWKHKDFQNQLVSSVLVDGNLFGASGDVASGAELVCVELMSGDVRWRSDAVRVGALSVAGDRLIVLSDSGELVIAKTSPERFEILARHQVLEGKCWTAPVLSNGRIYCRTASGQIVCIDVRS
jgi:outer membrane protein assembly factor BamB